MIDISKVKFKEFEELANHANAMLKAKIFSNKHLEQYKKIVSSSDDFLALIDRNYTYLAISEAYQKFFNKEKEEILGHTMPELYGAQYFVENLKHLSDRVLAGETFEHEFWSYSALGKRFLHTKYFPYYEKEDDPLPMAYVVSARDNTEKKANEDRLIASEKELEYLAHNDALTGLPNRLLLTDRISHAIENSKRQGGMIAVCFIDLDNFKKVNDTYGHDQGDAVLKNLAGHMKGNFRENDICCRMGGEEFAVLMSTADRDAVFNAAERLRKTVAQSSTNGLDPVTISIGIAFWPDDSEHIKEVFKHADNRLYQAKNEGRNCVR